MALLHASTPEHADFKVPQRFEFTTDLTNTSVPQSPFSIRYYTVNPPAALSSGRLPIQIQIDGGANRSITPRQDLLHRYKTTAAYPIYGVNKDDVALQCVGRGYLPWVADNGDTLYIPTETIISPTDVVLSHNHLFCAWAQFSHCATGQGHVTFYRSDGTNHTNFPLVMRNGLWYDCPYDHS